MTPRLAHIALNMMSDMGPVRVHNLTQALGGVEHIFSADAELLASVPGIGPKTAQRIVEQRGRLDPEAEEAAAKRLGAHILTPLDEAYPKGLRTIHDPPLALYVLGSLEAVDEQAVALVGTRRNSHYGGSTADRLAYGLGRAGVTVVSGLARGIDTFSHEGALKAGGRTLAVLGSALDCLYPAENRDLANKIVKHGAVLSEFCLGTEPGKTTFAIRNRIISGLSLGVVVVEAGRKGGAMITAHAALDQGRSVMAVPGPVDRESFRGCHALIKDGARLVEGVEDVLEEFAWMAEEPAEQDEPVVSRKGLIQLDPEEKQVAEALLAGALDVDSLARACEIPVSRLNVLLLGMEMKRVIEMLPGRQVSLTAGATQGM